VFGFSKDKAPQKNKKKKTYTDFFSKCKKAGVKNSPLRRKDEHTHNVTARRISGLNKPSADRRGEGKKKREKRHGGKTPAMPQPLKLLSIEQKKKK